MKKKTTKYQDLKWWFFMRKIHFRNWKFDTNYSILKFMHCRKGFHDMKKDGITLIMKSPGKKERKWKTTFFKCRVCNLIQFPTEKDKRNWEFIEDRQNKNIKLMVDDVIKKRNKK